MHDSDEIDDVAGTGEEEARTEEEGGHGGTVAGAIIGGIVGGVVGGIVGGMIDGASDESEQSGEAGTTTFTGPRIVPDNVDEE
jgi:tetrahydromethanopterin S-methyltransferase subunit D